MVFLFFIFGINISHRGLAVVWVFLLPRVWLWMVTFFFLVPNKQFFGRTNSTINLFVPYFWAKFKRGYTYYTHHHGSPDACNSRRYPARGRSHRRRKEVRCDDTQRRYQSCMEVYNQPESVTEYLCIRSSEVRFWMLIAVPDIVVTMDT